MIRIVADTNVYISGIFWPGLNRLVLNLARHEVISLVCSPSLLREFTETLQGKKFSLSKGQIDVLVGDIIGFTVPVQEEAYTHPVLRDPKDNFVCALAVMSRADFLVTGDKDLLVLAKVRKTRILSARGFLEKEFSELMSAYEEGLEDRPIR